MSLGGPGHSVSIIIPVLNGAATIADAIRGVLSQRWAGPRPEVIVVDNGSSDSTPEVVSEFPVRLLHEPERGVAAARNRGLRAARGEIIACLDADTLPTRTWLHHLVAPLEDPGVCQVGGTVASFKPSSPAERFADALGFFRPDHSVERERNPFVPGLNTAVRRSDAQAIGGWCEDFRFGEDVDFSFRLTRRTGSRLAHSPHAVVFHRHRQDDESLWRQARGWGAGAGMVCRRYPDVLIGGWAGLVRLRLSMSLHRAWASVCSGLARLGAVSARRAEFEQYHGRWLRAYWEGFREGYGSDVPAQGGAS